MLLAPCICASVIHTRQESLCFFYRSFSSALSFLVVLHRVYFIGSDPDVRCFSGNMPVSSFSPLSCHLKAQSLSDNCSMDNLPDSLSSILLPDLNGCTGWSAKSMHLLSQDMIYTGFQIHGPCRNTYDSGTWHSILTYIS